MLRGTRGSPIALFGGLLAAILFLAATGFLVVAGTHFDRLPGLLTNVTFVELFSLDSENTVPTWFSSTLLVACATFLAVIGVVKRRARAPYAWHWLGLAAIFVYLSVDEASSIHEHRGAPGIGDTSGLLFFEWVILGIVAVVIVAFLFRRFILHLPRRTGVLFALAGVIYVTGALGFELIGGRHADLFGQDNTTYRVITSFEELIEMVGIALFISALYWYFITTVQVRMELISEARQKRPPTATHAELPQKNRTATPISPAWAERTTAAGPASSRSSHG